MKKICLKYKCKDCPNKLKCFIEERSFKLTKRSKKYGKKQMESNKG